jgi:glycosyltransferase involved in cell wall biosynthesis
MKRSSIATGETVMADGVSFLIPVHGDASALGRVLRAIAAQEIEGAREVLMIDDGARQSTRKILEAWSQKSAFRLLEGERRGAAAALNAGIRAASHPWIAQVDQDVVLSEGWLARLMEYASDPDLGAVQGHWVTDRQASIWSRVAGLDL